MIWAGALTSMKYLYLNFSTFTQLNNSKKAKGDIQKAKGDGPTDRPTDTVTYRSRCPRQMNFLARFKQVPTFLSTYKSVHDGISFPSRDDGIPGSIGSPTAQTASSSKSRPPLRVDRHSFVHEIRPFVASTIHFEHLVIVVKR